MEKRTGTPKKRDTGRGRKARGKEGGGKKREKEKEIAKIENDCQIGHRVLVPLNLE